MPHDNGKPSLDEPCMAIRYILAGALIPVLFAGCEWTRSFWPEWKRDVPVTPPKDEAAAPPAQAPPATVTARTPPTAPAPTTAKAPTGYSPADGGRVLSQTKLVAASILQVNERFLTVEDILRGVGSRLAEVPKNITEQSWREQAAKILREEIRRQVRDSLVYAEAQRRLTDEQKKQVDKEVEEALRNMEAAVGGSRKKLEQELAKENATLDAVLQEHRVQATNATYLRARFMPAVVVNHRMLLEYYRRNPSEFAEPKKVQMQLIAAPFKSFLAEGAGSPTPAEMEAAKAKAKEHVEKAAAALKEGADFTKAVKEMSRGVMPDAEGVWPLMPAGSFREAKVEEAAFALQEGQVSGIIETADGYYIVKARKVEPGKAIGFEDAQVKIEKRLRDEQYQKIIDDYFKKLFVEGATIIESDKFLELALARAVEKHWKPVRP